MSDLLTAYKEVMSHWPSGVAIVTSVLGSKRYGMTISSFTSVSLHPAMVSICVDKRAQMCGLLQKSKKFSVNILDNTQVELALAFANHDIEMHERFQKAEFNNSETQSPVLNPCLAWLDCELHSFHDTGDHVIYVGQVLKAKTVEQKDPVIYYKRGWYGHLTRL
ncbi:MAG: flavin reductase family protein [Myxococcaceae bacterium]